MHLTWFYISWLKLVQTGPLYHIAVVKPIG